MDIHSKNKNIYNENKIIRKQKYKLSYNYNRFEMCTYIMLCNAKHDSQIFNKTITYTLQKNN